VRRSSRPTIFWYRGNDWFYIPPSRKEIAMIAFDRVEAKPWWLRVIVGRRPFLTLLRILFVITLATFLFKVVLVPIRVRGSSMIPTYYDGAINFVNRLSYRHSKPRRGDIVVIIEPERHEFLVLKRVVGLPGETIAVRRGAISINGIPYQDKYSKEPLTHAFRSRKLAEGEYFVIGDNRIVSEYYFVTVPEIVGKVIF
jgi:signal peptidase I